MLEALVIELLRLKLDVHKSGLFVDLSIRRVDAKKRRLSLTPEAAGLLARSAFHYGNLKECITCSVVIRFKPSLTERVTLFVCLLNCL